MTKRNIHGAWTIRFEDRILYSKVIGATNKEAAESWFEEVRQHITFSYSNCIEGWVFINDARQWDLSSPDFWEGANKAIEWMCNHNCIFMALVHSKQIQNFVTEKELDGHGVVHLFFDYDEAYQACLDKLAEAKRKQDK
ncbi:hypothetical protein L4C34_20070 [Vibrio profundum]|uniref:hypothetical protein n=1 Tax=Vibrio profundum TaxID=2910247 RepID=UPI003D0CBF8F